MKRILFLLLFLPLFTYSQLYYVKPTTGSTPAPSGDFVPPSTWVDSLGAITAARMGADGSIPANTIRILVNADNDVQTFAFTVTCVGGYKVKWGLGESWINYNSATLAERTYDTSKCQTYSIIEIQPQGANGITVFTVSVPVTFVIKQVPTYPSYLWVSANYTGAAPALAVINNLYSTSVRSIYLKTVTSLPDYCFYHCHSNVFTTIPTSVTAIGSGCFAYNYALPSITIPSSVTSIGSVCFLDDWSLNTIIMTSTALTIGAQAFMGNFSLSSITIPSGTTSFGPQLFNSCYLVENIIYTGTITTAADHNAMLRNCEQIKQLDWSGVKSTSFGFYGASGKLNKLGSIAGDTLPLKINWSGSTFASTTAPQLNLSYNSLDTTQIRRIFQKLPTVGAAGSNTKQLTVVGCSGAATLSAAQRAYATNKGWQVLYYKPLSDLEKALFFNKPYHP